MLDIQLFREHPEIIRKNLEKRKDSEKLNQVDDIIKLDSEWRKRKADLDSLRAERNKVSMEINALKKEGKDASKQIKKAASLPKEIAEGEKWVSEAEEKLRNYLMRMPNILHESVPYGKDDSENVEVRKWGKIPKFDFELKTHVEIAEKIGADFDRATKLSGSGFFVLTGEIALLEQAIARFAIDTLIKKGYKLFLPPFMIKRKPYEGVTDLSDFEKVMYKVENDDEYLIATSEHPMAAFFMNETIDEKMLPIKFAGYSQCFRKEIGAHGIDTKGLFRRHQFNKVEQFVFCRPEDSWKIHEEMIKNAEDVFKGLELPYHVVNICTGDIGTVAAKKYDIEAWMPRQNKYGEVVSCSNCTDYQARRLNIKCGKEGGEKRVLHTLNSTAVATSRALVAVLENYQNKDGTVNVPKVLVPYMNGLKVLGNK
ncbi:MAG: serine--tRNA ligase [Candidatus Nanoarchaeia archaeon]|nr:serine--tRNA ligase [Candidatus Nanoarchaeia archaeon]